MHEYALADAVVKAALEAAGHAGITTIDHIVVGVGELQDIRADLFEWSLTEVLPAEHDALAGVRFTVEREAAAFLCRPCGRRFHRGEAGGGATDEVEAMHLLPEMAHAFLRCPECSSPDFEVVAGRGVVLRSVEGSRDGEEV
jgi:hydrogenase nickel incorporation protein HypA/HybF